MMSSRWNLRSDHHTARFAWLEPQSLALGMITPPFGVNLFAACTVAKISLDRIVTRLIPFVPVMLGCLMLITYVPPISLALRNLVYHTAK